MSLAESLRRRNPGVSLGRVLWWELARSTLRLLHWTLYRHRAWGVLNIPAVGPVLLVSNHQSFLDLSTLGAGLTHRHFWSMARATLFKHRLFGAWIGSYNSFGVEQGKGDIAAIRQAIDVLKCGRLLLVFPEGSRSPDGRIKPFQPGIMTLIRRARPMVVPMAVEGPFDIWPRARKWPKFYGRTAAMYGRPIPASQLVAMKPADAANLLRDRVIAMRMELRRRLRHQTHGRFPPRSIVDEPDDPPLGDADR